MMYEASFAAIPSWDPCFATLLSEAENPLVLSSMAERSLVMTSLEK